MKLDYEKLSQIQTVLQKDDESVDFTTNKFKKGLYYVSNSKVHKFGEEKGKDNESEIEQTFSSNGLDRPLSEFFEQINDKELTARIFLGWSEGVAQYQEFKNWNTLAKVLGITKLVTLATKVPHVVAKRFEMFANQRSDRSAVLRSLVYNYVKNQMIKQAEDLMFKEEI